MASEGGAAQDELAPRPDAPNQSIPVSFRSVKPSRGNCLAPRIDIEVDMDEVYRADRRDGTAPDDIGRGYRKTSLAGSAESSRFAIASTARSSVAKNVRIGRH